MIENYQEAITYIHSRPKLHKLPGLDRVKQILAQLDNPQDTIDFIHVTGTNGKGSTVNYISQILSDLGLKVGRYTSPFITRFNERIAINQEPISDEQLVAILNQVLTAQQNISQTFELTEFELITVMMFTYFKSENIDVGIIEVGIGGLYDSTNVINPCVAVITSIGMDHSKLLGNTIEEIARQKAGIIKANKPVVIGELTPEAYQIMLETTMKKNSQLFTLNENFKVNQQKILPTWQQQFDFTNDRNLKINQVVLNQMGDYQIANAAIAIQAVAIFAEQKGYQLSQKDYKKSLLKATWAGRFEKVNDEPIIILDGAHNMQGITKLFETTKHLFKKRQLFILYAAMADKDIAHILPILKKQSQKLILTTVPNLPRSAKAIDYQLLDDTIEYKALWPEGLKMLLQLMDSEDVLLITGSLYFISDVRKYFKE